MQVRDFDAARAERRRQVDPLAFQLGGERFTCVDRIPVGAAFDLMDAPEITPSTYPQCARAVERFIRLALVDDDERGRWDALLRRVEDPIDDWAIIEVGTWLAEAYAGVPFSERGDSSSPRPDAGATSPSPATGPVSATSST